MLPPVPLWYCTWAWFNREALSAMVLGKGFCQAVSVTQPDRLTLLCDHTSHVLRHHIGVTTAERPDPKGLFTFSQCIKFPMHRGFKLVSLNLELGPLTKWLASWMLVLVSRQAYNGSYCSTTEQLGMSSECPSYSLFACDNQVMASICEGAIF